MYEQYADDIFRYLYVRVKDVQLAEDITADVFTRAWKNIDRFDFKHSRGWLYKIAQNSLIDHWRKKKDMHLDEDMEVASDADSLEDQVDTILDAQLVRSAIAKLPPNMQSVVTMRFLLGYSAKKTAESLSTTENNVRIIQFRALKKMEAMLK